MKFIFAFIFAFFSFSSIYAQLSSPESVDCHRASNTYFVASTSNNRIVKINPQTGATSLFVNVTSPYGIEVVGDTLFVCSRGTVKGYNINNGTSVFNLNLGGSFLNGITHDNAGNLYVSDFSAKKIYKITRGTSPSFSTFVSNTTETPNGIIYDALNHRLLYVTWGTNAKIKALNLDGTALPNVLNSSHSNIDGIALDNQNNIFLSMWGGQKVVQYNPTATSILNTITTGIGNPADIYYNTATDTLAIPNTSLNTVKFIGFNNATGIETPTKNEFSFFPNPFQNVIQIKNERNFPIKIYSSNGKLMYVNKNANAVIPTANWAKDVYFIHYKNEIHKIVKQ